MGIPAGKDYPLLEGNLCKCKPGNYPPVTIHGYDYELAAAICNHYEYVALPIGDKQATLQIQAKRTTSSTTIHTHNRRKNKFRNLFSKVAHAQNTVSFGH
eukprot:4118205-Prymnesium_polylepis.2